VKGDRAGMGGKYFGDYFENWGKKDKRRHSQKLRRNAKIEIKDTENGR
jgi:hypothetical protein